MKESEIRFFKFMAKREALRLKKETGAAWPWSDDWILNEFKFTNVKREHDRTTRWMRQFWTTPNQHRPPGEIIFNCALFRYFGTIEFAATVQWQTHWAPESVGDVAASMMARGEKVFTGAYIIPSQGAGTPKARYVCGSVLTPLWHSRDRVAQVATATRSWRAAATVLRALPGFGGTGFLAKEVLQDVIQTPVLRDCVDRNMWCPAGPGARRGLNRIHGRPLSSSMSEQVALSEMLALFERAQESLPDYMPILELHDIQFQLCEFDKYERVRMGEGRPRSRYRPPILSGALATTADCQHLPQDR